MRRVASAVAVALLLLLAGCSVAPGPGGDTTGPPPGVGDGELSNATALVTAHEDALVGTGFEYVAQVNATATRRTQEGRQTVAVDRRQATTVAADGSYRYRLVNGGTGARIDAWANQTVEVDRIRAGGQTRYRTVQPRPPAELAGGALLRQYLGSGLAVESTNETDGRTYYTLASTASEPPEGALPANATDVEDYQVRAVVDDQGRVHVLAAAANYTIGGERATLDVGYRLERTGVERVERPAWVDQVE